jgi:hypothetical protein
MRRVKVLEPLPVQGLGVPLTRAASGALQPGLHPQDWPTGNDGRPGATPVHGADGVRSRFCRRVGAAPFEALACRVAVPRDTDAVCVWPRLRLTGWRVIVRLQKSAMPRTSP